jgi:hypothetical protein
MGTVSITVPQIAFAFHSVTALHNYQAAVAFRANGEFVRQDEIPAFVLRQIA